MSEQAKRSVPPGGRQLADRIAALQRKASGQDAPLSPTAPRLPSSSASLSPRDAIRSTSAGSQAVRDRIARFQAGADGGGEKPLVPRSSFGAPAPAPGTGQGSLRPYPGAASGGGSGSWGEGVLRPQLTGGAWLHAGSEGGLRPQYTGTSGPGLRPQMTGGAWGRSPSYSETPLPRVLGSGRDAFLDLDDDSSRLASSRFGTSPGSTPSGSLAGSPARPQPKRGGSFTTAQLDAASAGLQRTSSLRRSVDEGRDPDSAMLDYARAESPSGSLSKQGKPSLPDVPTAEPKQLTPPKRNGSTSSTAAADFQLPTLPETPAALPERISSSLGATSVSSDVELEVGNVSAEQMAKMRATLSLSPDTSFDGNGEISSPLNRPALSERTDASGDGAERIGRLAIDDLADDEDDDASFQNVSASSSAATDYGPDSSDPAAYSSDPVTDAASVLTSRSGARGRPSLHRSVDSNESGVLDPARDTTANSDGTLTASGSAATLTASTSSSALGSTSYPSNGSIKVTINDAQRSPPPTSSPPRNAKASSPASPLSPSSAVAAQRAREAISLGRNKSQRLRRPPPGMTLSAAEMDQSDDEYEPGWASVISSSRN